MSSEPIAKEPNLTLVEDPTTAKGPKDPRIGERLDNRYIIKKMLGQGGMGVVYFALHEALEKPVAIKVLKPDVSRDEKIIARFRREARSASAIGSPHICDVSDFGTLDDGSTYFVMEMLDGPPLTKFMSGEPLETKRILKIGAQLSDALGAAHARQIVHRDLKPDNVHLVRHGNDHEFVKVLDFGIAKVANTGETKLTQAGQVFGTPHYMSPEQCAGHDVDHRTDIYALGVMLYEMACGRVPFDADNLMGLLTKHVYEQPIPPRQLPPPVDVPPGLEAIILKCLAKKPSSRYQTMAELKLDLDSLAAGETPEAVMAEIDRSLPARPSSPFTDQVVPGEPPGGAPSLDTEAPAAAPEKKSSGLKMALIAIPVVAAVAFGVTYFVMPGDPPPVVEDDPAPVDDPADDPVVAETDPDPDPDPEADTNPTPEADPAPAAVSTSVLLSTEPEGAEVFGPDGSLVGNTPVTIMKPATGEPPVEYRIHLSGFTERSFTVGAMTQPEVMLTMDNRRRPTIRRRGSTRGSSTSTGSGSTSTGSTSTGSTGTGSTSTGSTSTGSTSGRRGSTPPAGGTGPSAADLHQMPTF